MPTKSHTTKVVSENTLLPPAHTNLVGHHRMHSGALQDSAQQILSNLGGGSSGLGISGIARNQPKSLNPGLNFSLSGHSQSDIFVNPLGRGGKAQARTAIPTKESTTPSGAAMLKNQASLGIFGERKNLIKQHDLNEAASKRPVPIRSQNLNVFKQSELNSLLRN